MFVISPITKEQVGKLERQLAVSGTSIQTIEPNKYQIVGHGITANATFDETLQKLAVVVVHKPFFIGEDMIHSGIVEAMKK